MKHSGELFGMKHPVVVVGKVGFRLDGVESAGGAEGQKVDEDGRPVWFGSVTYDKGGGLSHTTGQVTHHIAADVDAERDRLFQDFEQTESLTETYVVEGFHKKTEGRNGGGDPWHTDGKLYVGVIKK